MNNRKDVPIEKTSRLFGLSILGCLGCMWVGVAGMVHTFETGDGLGMVGSGIAFGALALAEFRK
jgi:hypothetical protein